MDNEELMQEMEEQSEYEHDHTQQYDDATYTPVEIDFTTQSWHSRYQKLITCYRHWIQCQHMMSQGQESWSHMV